MPKLKGWSPRPDPNRTYLQAHLSDYELGRIISALDAVAPSKASDLRAYLVYLKYSAKPIKHKDVARYMDRDGDYVSLEDL